MRRTYRVYEGNNDTDAAKRIHSLREFYRREFSNGVSDESFLLWLETSLENARIKQEGESHD